MLLPISQIVVSTLLIIFILLQERTSGLSGLFGGEGGFYQTRRGLERIIFWGTVFLGILFVALAIAGLVK